MLFTPYICAKLYIYIKKKKKKEKGGGCWGGGKEGRGGNLDLDGKPFGFVKKHGRQGGGAYFLYISL